jgi:hypothetical protein
MSLFEFQELVNYRREYGSFNTISFQLTKSRHREVSNPLVCGLLFSTRISSDNPVAIGQHAISQESNFTGR